jgi:hypothetical protein
VSVLQNFVESEARFHCVGSDEKFVGSEAADGSIVLFDVSAVPPEQAVGEPNKLRDGFPVERRPASRMSSKHARLSASDDKMHCNVELFFAPTIRTRTTKDSILFLVVRQGLR